ncbi:RNA polymerase sigma factor [Fulvivirgaceae bacterium BMA10]|uniref:RNA polymerase sigma factor n=1 Tax=Splendidivirga corallicola TaxID=3051826 RepID=A0ABT8KU52_9BACT|nr:RNA polymerase sigma factor [Fulvivirgaceae bacterium BMA10]
MDRAVLVKKCIKKDRKALSFFYDTYKRKLMGICLRYASNHFDADDIFQEAFIKIFENLKQLNEPKALDIWVKQIVVRTAINFYHDAQKTRQHLDHEEVNEPNEDYQKIMDEMGANQLVKLINQLPDGYRMVFNLYVLDGYKHREIAEMLGISENTSKSQLRDAKSHLKKMLQRAGINKYEAYV